MLSKKFIPGILLLLFVFFLNSCADKNEDVKQVNPAFSQYITGFTSGVISKKAQIVIQLSNASKLFTAVNAELEDDLFDFSPSVDGKAYWKNNQSIIFIPEVPLKSGTNYVVEFNLGEVMDVEPEFETFEFSLITRTQSFSVNVDGITPYENQELDWNSFSGNIRSADFLTDEEVEGLLHISQNGEKFDIVWSHASGGVYHGFKVDSVERKIEPEVLFLEWNGDAIDIEIEGELKYDIPSINDFKLMEVKVVQQPEQHIEMRFSDPLKLGQDLNGFIRLEDYNNFKFQTNGNIVKAYPAKRLSGVRYLLVETEIRNAMNYKLQETEKYEIEFVEVKPLIRISNEGVILPSTNGLMFPFEAVNLNAIDVKITKVFENNIHQFLQVNSPDGSYQLARVGKVIFRKKG